MASNSIRVRASNSTAFKKFVKPSQRLTQRGKELWISFFEDQPHKIPKKVKISEVVEYYARRLNLDQDSVFLKDIFKSLDASFMFSKDIFHSKTVIFHMKFQDIVMEPGANRIWRVNFSEGHGSVHLKARSKDEASVKMTEIIIESDVIPNPYCCIAILHAFMDNLGVDSEYMHAPNIIHSYKCVAQVTYNLIENAEPEEGDTMVVEYQRVKRQGESFKSMTKYFEKCMRAFQLRLKGYEYDMNIDEDVTLLRNHNSFAFRRSCPCDSVEECRGSVEFLRENRFCPYFFV